MLHRKGLEYLEYLYIMEARVICLMQTTTYCVLQSIPGNWNFHKVGGNFWLLCYLSCRMHFPCCNGKLWVQHSEVVDEEDVFIFQRISPSPSVKSHSQSILIGFTFIWFWDYNPCTLSCESGTIEIEFIKCRIPVQVDIIELKHWIEFCWLFSQ